MKRGRKRIRQKDKWVRNVRKRLRNSGKSYVGCTGKRVLAKEFVAGNCNCKKRCSAAVNATTQKALFESFWGMKNFSKQNVYLCGLVQATKVKRSRRPRNNNKHGVKSKTLKYFVHAPRATQVCKKFLLQTFNISDLSRALKVVEVVGTSPGTDKRGTGISHNKTDSESGTG